MKNNIMIRTMLVISACLLMAQPVYAIDLQTAKSQGLIGETPSGYLEAVTPPSAETKALIDSINEKRKQIYQQSAARNNITLQDVEILAGKKGIEKSKPGSYIKQNGVWQKK